MDSMREKRMKIIKSTVAAAVINPLIPPAIAQGLAAFEAELVDQEARLRSLERAIFSEEKR